MSEPLKVMNADLAGRRTRKVASRYRAALRVEGVLGALRPGDPALLRLSRARTSDDGRFALLTGLALESPEFRALLESLERSMAATEQTLLGLDREVPGDRFRECLQAGGFETAALADYVSLLCRSREVDVPLSDRVRVLVASVTRQRAGNAEGLGGARLRETLSEVLPPTSLPASSVEPSVAWFQRTARRVVEAASLEALIESNFFFDARALWTSTGRALLEPEVMAASLELDAAISDLIDREAQGDAGEGASLRRHLALAENQARSPVHVEPRATAVKASERTLSPAVGTKRSASRRAPKLPKWTSAMRVAGLALAATVATFVAQLPGEGALSKLGAKERQGFTPLLTEAGLAPAQRPLALIGRFDGAAWNRTPAAERQVVARDLATQIASRGLTSATVLVNATVVVRIEQGRVLVVE